MVRKIKIEKWLLSLSISLENEMVTELDAATLKSLPKLS